MTLGNMKGVALHDDSTEFIIFYFCLFIVLLLLYGLVTVFSSNPFPAEVEMGPFNKQALINWLYLHLTSPAKQHTSDSLV